MFDEKYLKEQLKVLDLKLKLLEERQQYSQGVFALQQQQLYPNNTENYIPQTENPLIVPDTSNPIYSDISIEIGQLNNKLAKLTDSVQAQAIIDELTPDEIKTLNTFFQDFRKTVQEKGAKFRNTEQLVDYIKLYIGKRSFSASQNQNKSKLTTDSLNNSNVAVPPSRQDGSISTNEFNNQMNDLNDVKTESSYDSRAIAPAPPEIVSVPPVGVKAPQEIEMQDLGYPKTIKELNNKYFLNNPPDNSKISTNNLLRKAFLSYYLDMIEKSEKNEEIKIQILELARNTMKSNNKPFKQLTSPQTEKLYNDIRQIVINNNDFMGNGFKHRRKVGRGTSSDYEKGKIFIDFSKLNNDVLSIKYRKTGNKAVEDMPINGMVKQCIIDLCMGKFDKNKFNKLSVEEKKIIVYVHDKFQFAVLSDEINPILGLEKEYKLLIGQIEAGNDSSLIKKRIKEILFELVKYKKISSSLMRNIVFRLDNSD